MGFADEDSKLKARVESRNELESYAYSLKNQINDKEKLGAKISDEDKEKIEEAVNEKMGWLEENQEADSEDFKKQKKELEDAVQPTLQNFTNKGEHHLQVKMVERMRQTKMSYNRKIVLITKTQWLEYFLRHSILSGIIHYAERKVFYFFQ